MDRLLKWRINKASASSEIQSTSDAVGERVLERAHDMPSSAASSSIPFIDPFGESLDTADRNFGIQIISSPADADVDIWFVHGLSGNRESTWTHPNGTFTPDLVRTYYPTARIITYGYDANVVSLWKNTSGGGLRALGQALAYDISNSRPNEAKRPLFFIAHSLGGIVTEQALLVSLEPNERFHSIAACTAGIIFMGTPQSGPYLATWGYTLAKLLDRFSNTNKDILLVLKRKSEVFKGIPEAFQRHLTGDGALSYVKIFCFYETLAVDAVGFVVPEESAITPPYSNCGINANHINMTKFSGVNDAGFVQMKGILDDWIKPGTDQATRNTDALAYSIASPATLTFNDKTFNDRTFSDRTSSGRTFSGPTFGDRAFNNKKITGGVFQQASGNAGREISYENVTSQSAGHHRLNRDNTPVPDTKMDQRRLLMEGSKPTPETYYYGLQGGLKLIASTIPDALNQTLSRDPTDAGFFTKKHMFTVNRDHQIVSRWESLILPAIRNRNHSKILVSVDCIRIGTEKSPTENPVIILIRVKNGSLNENEGYQLAKGIVSMCLEFDVTDVHVEIVEMLVPHAAQRAGGSGDPHILEGPFDKNIYIGSSVGPPFNSNGIGSSGTFAAHFIARRETAVPQDELLLALTCDHVCFDFARPCQEPNLDRWAYKIPENSNVRYEMLTPSDPDREATEWSLQDQLQAESDEYDRLKKSGDEQAIMEQEELKRTAALKVTEFSSATRRLGVVFGTGGARVDAATQMPMDWGVILEDLDLQDSSLELENLNKLPPINFREGANTISAIQKELALRQEARFRPQLGRPVAGVLPPGALPTQISRLRSEEPEANEVFFKVGRTTGWTAGQYNPCRSMVFSTLSTPHPGQSGSLHGEEAWQHKYLDYGWCMYWCFLGIPPGVPFGASGDSGSLVFDRTGAATGLYFSGFNTIPDISCVISLDTIIKDIERQLHLVDIRLASSDNYGA